MMVSGASLGVIIFNIVFSVAFPLGLALFFSKKHKASWLALLMGTATFVVFALILERILHTVVLASPLGRILNANILFYALYGGLAAGVFEETGRYLVMKHMMKRLHDNSHNALMFGVGHGGIELIVIFGITMVNNLVYSILINSGQIETVMAGLDEAQKAALETVVSQLVGTGFGTFLLGTLERVAAVALHIALSAIVWRAAVNGKKVMYPLAIGIHFLFDFVAGILSGNGISPLLIIVIMLVMSGTVCFCTYPVCRKTEADLEEGTNK